jgi:hypothetical protein
MAQLKSPVPQIRKTLKGIMPAVPHREISNDQAGPRKDCAAVAWQANLAGESF